MAEAGRQNYTSIPNMVFKLGLSPLAVLLYVHFAHLDYLTERRPDGVRVLMDLYKASSRSIAAAKKELTDHGLIEVQSRRAKGLPDVVKVKDIWKRNLLYHKGDMPSPDSLEQQVDDLTPQGYTAVFREQQVDKKVLPQGDSKNKNSLKEDKKAISAIAAVADADPVERRIWTDGKDLLRKSGMAESSLGSFLGKMAKDYGNELLAEAIAVTQAKNPAEPKEFLIGVLRERSGKNRPTVGRNVPDPEEPAARTPDCSMCYDLRVKYVKADTGGTERINCPQCSDGKPIDEQF